MTDIYFRRPQGIVIGNQQLDIYHIHPIPVYNVTHIDLLGQDVTPTSGTILIASFPANVSPVLNRFLGALVSFNLTTSGGPVIDKVFESNLRRSNVSVSGANVVGGI